MDIAVLVQVLASLATFVVAAGILYQGREARRAQIGKRRRPLREFRKAKFGKTLAHHFGEARKRVLVRDIDLLFPGLHGARFPEHPEGPGDRLTVRSHHAG